MSDKELQSQVATTQSKPALLNKREKGGASLLSRGLEHLASLQNGWLTQRLSEANHRMRINALVLLGQERGYVSRAEITRFIPGSEYNNEESAALNTTLSKHGINLIDKSKYDINLNETPLALLSRGFRMTSPEKNPCVDSIEGRICLMQALGMGETRAAFVLACLYHDGKGTNIDLPKAFSLHMIGAQHGEAPSMYQVAMMYKLGQGVEQNYFLAAKWFRDASALGDADSQAQLGCQHFIGQGVEQSYSTAIELFNQSAHTNNPVAQCMLGIAYAKGYGIQKSDERAAKHISLALNSASHKLVKLWLDSYKVDWSKYQ